MDFVVGNSTHFSLASFSNAFMQACWKPFQSWLKSAPNSSNATCE